jgi:hypothetical protein
MLLMAAAAAMALSDTAWSTPHKEQDFDIVYDESRVPEYQLPPLLVSADGDTIATAEDWKTRRRPQLLALFSNLVYGSVPAPASRLETTYEVVREDAGFMDGKAERKQVRIQFQNAQGKAQMEILLFTPSGAAGPVPALMLHSFDSIDSRAFREGSGRDGRLRNGVPLGALLENGFGFVAVYQQDLAAHNEVDFNSRIFPLFYEEGQSFPKANEWGVLSVVAWGAMRALDYLESDATVDATRVAIMGHSKMGKAALWTAAQDERFAAAVSVQSGCAGAALWRRRSGETLEKMVTRFPYWLCRNAWKFIGQEDDLPVDQHMLLALVAPRPLYVCSAAGDGWADPRGEYLSAYHASEVFRLLGKDGLETEVSPAVGVANVESHVAYHLREGGHSVDAYDWERIAEFLAHHLRERAWE